MDEKNKIKDEYKSILTQIEGRLPQRYTRLVRQKIGDEAKYVSDFMIQNVKNGKTPNIRIARILQEIANEWCPNE
ncbi:hypothetical protein [Raineya sp.]